MTTTQQKATSRPVAAKANIPNPLGLYALFPVFSGDYSHSIALECVVARRTTGERVNSCTVVVNHVPHLAYIGPFYDTDHRDAFLRLLDTTLRWSGRCFAENTARFPAAYRPVGVIGELWIGFELSNRAAVAELSLFGSDVDELGPICTQALELYKVKFPDQYAANPICVARTDRNVRDAWTRITASYAIPGWIALDSAKTAVCLGSTHTLCLTAGEFVSWLATGAEPASYNLSPTPTFRVAVTRSASSGIGGGGGSVPLREPFVLFGMRFGATHEPAKRNCVLITPETVPIDTELSRRRVHKHEADLYIYLESSDSVQTAAAATRKIKPEGVHSALLRALHDLKIAHHTPFHLICTTRTEADDKQPLRSLRIAQLVHAWLEHMFILSLVSGQALSIVADPTSSRSKRQTESFLARLLIRKGYGILPGAAENKKAGIASESDAAAANKVDDDHYAGGFNAPVTRALHLNTDIVEFDVLSCYASVIVEARLCPTNETLWDDLRHCRPSNVAPVEQRIYAAQVANALRDTPQPALGEEVLRCRALRIKYKNTPLDPALKRYINALYGNFKSVHFRFYAPNMAALISALMRRWVDDMRQAFVDCCGAGTEVLMCITDSVVVKLPPKTHASEAIDRCRFWFAKRFEYMSLSIARYSAMIIAERGHYAALSSDGGELEDRGFVSREAECPEVFRHVLRTVLRKALSDGPKKESAETKLASWLSCCSEIQADPPVFTSLDQVTPYHVRLSAPRRKQFQVSFVGGGNGCSAGSAVPPNAAVALPVVSLRVAGDPKSGICMHADTNSLPTITRDAWHNWYLDRYLRRALKFIFKIWSPDVIDEALYQVFDLAKPPAVPRRDKGDFWVNVEALASQGMRPKTAAWNIELTCNSCDSLVRYDSSRDSQTSWRRKSAEQLSDLALAQARVTCPNCGKPLRGSGSNWGYNSNSAAAAAATATSTDSLVDTNSNQLRITVDANTTANDEADDDDGYLQARAAWHGYVDMIWELTDNAPANYAALFDGNAYQRTVPLQAATMGLQAFTSLPYLQQYAKPFEGPS